MDSVMEDVYEQRDRVLRSVRHTLNDAWIRNMKVTRDGEVMLFDDGSWKQVIHTYWLGGCYAIRFVDMSESEEICVSTLR